MRLAAPFVPPPVVISRQFAHKSGLADPFGCNHWPIDVLLGIRRVNVIATAAE